MDDSASEAISPVPIRTFYLPATHTTPSLTDVDRTIMCHGRPHGIPGIRGIITMQCGHHIANQLVCEMENAFTHKLKLNPNPNHAHKNKQPVPKFYLQFKCSVCHADVREPIDFDILSTWHGFNNWIAG